MPGRCGIRSRAGPDARVGRYRASTALRVERALDGVEYLARSKRLRQKAERLRRLGAKRRRGVCKTGKKDRRNAQLLAQPAGQLDAVDWAGQANVYKGERRAARRGERDCLRAGSGDPGNREAQLAEDFLDTAGDEGLVLDNQDARRLACAGPGNHLTPINCHERITQFAERRKVRETNGTAKRRFHPGSAVSQHNRRKGLK